VEHGVFQRESKEVGDVMRVSVAIPLLNEESILPELLRRIRGVLDMLPGGPHEIVIIDDGSTDRTPEILRKEVEDDPRLVGIVLSRNFGHQAAVTAALDHVSGDVVVVMDGDLQDPPEVIPLLLEKFHLGYDVVYVQHVGRKESWELRACYFLFYRLITILSEFQLPLDSGDFGLMSRRVVDELRRMPERHRYLRGMRSWVGFRQTGLLIERAERQGGESKYSFVKLLKLAADGIFSFSIIPLRVAAVLGGVAVFCTSAFSIWALFAKFVLHQSPRGFTSLILAVTFLAGVQLFFMGVIGEYVGRIFEASKGRPHYIVSHQYAVGNGGRSTNADRHTEAPAEHAGSR
jgi:glycosyltransferase involved in cell wall biosynthesis